MSVLADDAVYLGRGNHALNQSIGLLATAYVLHDETALALATRRLRNLVVDSVDADGVSNEQSTSYQYYNYRRYSLAMRYMDAIQIEAGKEFDRVSRMVDFMTHSTLPNGEDVMIGDSPRVTGRAVPATESEFARTRGEFGPCPEITTRVFDAGYLFARSGWGTRRHIVDESMISLRFGPARQFHGHHDGGALTFYAHGTRLLTNAGKYAYGDSAFRHYVRSRLAQNVMVQVDADARFDPRAATDLIEMKNEGDYVFAVVSSAANTGVAWVRSVLYLPSLDVVIVDDRYSSDRTVSMEQRWRLMPDAEVVVDHDVIGATIGPANVALAFFGDVARIGVVEGQEEPVDGWVSLDYGAITPAPVVRACSTGREGRVLTVIGGSPADSSTRSPTGVRIHPRGYSMSLDGDSGVSLMVEGSDVTLRGRRDQRV